MFGSLTTRSPRPATGANRSGLSVGDDFSRAFARMEMDMEEVMNRLFHGGETGAPTPISFVPKLNLAETENEYEVTVELPGLKPEEVAVEVRNGDLWITGERRVEEKEEGKTWHRVEHRYGEFRRVLPLPTDAEDEKIKANFENGMLKIAVPKCPAVKPRRVEVKA